VAFALTLTACRSPSPSAVVDAGAVAVADAAPPVDPVAHGKELVRLDCLSCHTEQLLEQQRLTPKQWAAVVKKMTGWGAPVEPETTEALVAYLAASYGPDAGAYAPPALAFAQAPLALAPTPDGPFANGDATRGAALYRDRCSACHGPDARGQLGIALVSRPILYRAADVAEMVRRGRGRMTPLEATDGEIADVLAHLRTL
jgi:mono/diheme cytochrome c family protein